MWGEEVAETGEMRGGEKRGGCCLRGAGQRGESERGRWRAMAAGGGVRFPRVTWLGMVVREVLAVAVLCRETGRRRGVVEGLCGILWI